MSEILVEWTDGMPLWVGVPYAPVALLLGQLPSHVANAERTRDFLGAAAGPDFMERYRAWEADYERYLAAVSADDAAEGAGATLLNMVGAGVHRYTMSK